MHIRISDFGLAKEENLELSQTKGIGTLQFMAPEFFDQNDIKYTNKVDVYSFGITLIYIVTEKYPPFSVKNVSKGVLPKFLESFVDWIHELIDCSLLVSFT